MLSKLIVTAAGIAAAGILSAPIAAAEEPTNTEVASNSIAPAACHDYSCRPWYEPCCGGFKNGLSGSSQAMLDRINEKKYHPQTP